MAGSFRPNRDLATAFAYDLLHNGQAEANPIVVHFRVPMQPAKLREQLWEVVFIDARACVPYMHNQELIGLIIADLDINATLLRELERVFNQINHHLFEAPLIADQNWKVELLTSIRLLVKVFVDARRREVITELALVALGC